MSVSEMPSTLAEENEKLRARVEELGIAIQEFVDCGPYGHWPQKFAALLKGIRVFKDGDAWCATGPGFRDLAVSQAGFGLNVAEAIADLRINEGKELGDGGAT